MKVEKLIVLVKTDTGDIKQVKLTKEQADQIAKIAITTSVVLSKENLNSVIDF